MGHLLPEFVMAENADSFKSVTWKAIDTQRIKVVSSKDQQNSQQTQSWKQMYQTAVNHSILIIKVGTYPGWPRALGTL